jgi:ribosomal protein S1
MVEIGSVIEARVVRLEPFGVWLKHGAEDVLVLVPELSWKPGTEPRQMAAIGDDLRVRVLRYNYKDRVILGSVKALYPEDNPFRKLARLEPGSVLVGKVRTVFDDEVRIDFDGGAWGKIPRNGLAADLHVGDEVEVVIQSLEVDEGLLTLDFVGKTGRSAKMDGPALHALNRQSTGR